MVLSNDGVHSLETAIREAAAAFENAELHYAHGTASAIDEATWLILSALKLSPLEAPDYQRLLTEQEQANCDHLLSQRLSTRSPAAYLTGETWFAGHRFACDSRALIPRSPIAELIVNDFYGLLDSLTEPQILDLCTGGGCIAIAIALQWPQAKVDASDLSADALQLAAHNVRLHQVESRVDLLHGSLFDPVNRSYDLIVSNPPYVDALDFNAMPAEFHHEPPLGLVAGEDGLSIVSKILAQAAHYLTDKGFLVVEVGNSMLALEDAYPNLDFQWVDFANGGDGVFVLSRDQLLRIKA